MRPATTVSASPAAAPAQTARAKVTVGTVVRAALRAISHRLQVRGLLEMDERMLRDIGLAPGDVHAALAGGIASDPSSRLAVTAARHAAAEQARLRVGLRPNALVKPPAPVRNSTAASLAAEAPGTAVIRDRAA